MACVDYIEKSDVTRAVITEMLEDRFTMREIWNAHAQFSRFLTPPQV